MKMNAEKFLFAVAVTFAAAAACADVTWSGDVVVPANTDVTCTDFSAVTSLSISSGATVRFDTATAPGFQITGSGTVVKESSAEWTMTASIPDFTGNYDIAAGVVNANVATPFGKDSNSYKVYVRSGATLAIASHSVFSARYIHIAGNGATGRKGAIEMPAKSSTDKYYYFNLDGDAKMYVPAGGLFFVSAVKLNGNRLVITGGGNPTLFPGTITTPGEIYLSNEEGSPLLYLRSWSHDNPTATIAPGDGPFVLSGETTLTIWDGIKPINRPLWVCGTNTLDHSSNNKSNLGFVTNHANWAGSVIFTNETGMSKLTVKNTVRSDLGSCMMVVSGPISGRGRVVTSINNISNRVALLNPANSYTGGTYINNNTITGGSTLLGYPGTIPNEDFASVTSDYGYVDLAVGDSDNPRWTYGKAVKFLNAATFKNSSKPRFTSEFLNGAVGTLKMSVDEGTTGMSGFLGALGTIRFEGDGNATPVPFHWHGGTALVTGSSPVLLGETFLCFTGSDATNSSVRIVDGAEVTLDIDETLFIGRSDSKQARLVVSNAVLKNSNVTKYNFSAAGDWGGLQGGSIFAGYYSPGILEVLDGAVISNRIVVCGFSKYGAWEGSSSGAVYQRGGRVVALGASVPHNTSCVGMLQGGGKGGYYELDDGVLEARGQFLIGGYGYGCFAQYGGHVITSNRLTNADGTRTTSLGLAYCNQGRATLYVKKGSWDVYTDAVMVGQGDSVKPTADITLDGDEALFDAHAAPIFVACKSSFGTYNINLNGGVLRCGGLRCYTKIYNISVPLSNTTFCVNFNGGTLRTGDSNRSIFGYASDDRDLWATNVIVYAGGATIDTAGKSGNTVKSSLRSAWGKGVKSIALGAPITGLDKINSPRVFIRGDGIGATAFAHFDSTNMVVDRIVVTSPGCGYTTATAEIYYGDTLYRTLTSSSGDVVLEDNEDTGPFTKAGDGTLTLSATNTWGGATVVAGGTLKAGCDWAVPADSALVIKGGGVLDLNGKEARISSVEYGPGGGSIANAAAAELPATFSMRTTIDDVLAGRAIAFSGSQDLTGITLAVEGDDYSALDKNVRRYRVLTVSGGVLTGAPTIVAEPPPAPWAYTVRTDGVLLNYVAGAVFTLR